MKRLIGRDWLDAAVQQDIKHWPFEVVANDLGKPVIKVQREDFSRTLSPQEVSLVTAIKVGLEQKIIQKTYSEEVREKGFNKYVSFQSCISNSAYVSRAMFSITH